jgi:methyl-accepting chemotaxis protein
MFSLSLFVLTSVSFFAIYKLELHAENNLKISASDMAAINSIGRIKTLLSHQTEEWKNIIIRGSNPEENAKHSLELEKVAMLIDSSSEVLRAQLTENNREVFNNLIRDNLELKEKYKIAKDKYLTVAKFLPNEADILLMDKDKKNLDNLIALDNSITNEAEKHNTESRNEMKELFNKTLVLIVVIILLSLFVGQFVINRMVNSISKITKGLLGNTSQVTLASLQISNAAKDLSGAVTEQATSLVETSASIEEISSMVNANTENAKQSSIVSGQSLVTAERGKEVIDHMIVAIGDITTSNASIMNQINETNREIENIITIINEISTKTKVINDIVFQTKLLSFNAAVEAARAGEQGKGFTVVAEEVGNLAAMSGAAALEISNMLDRSINKVEEIVRESKDKIGKLIQNGKEKVETGTRIAHECEDVLNDIVSSASKVSSMITEISSASLEQAQAVREITKTIAQLDQFTQQNSASSSDSANAAAALLVQAQELDLSVQSLAQTIDGNAKFKSINSPNPESNPQSKSESKAESKYGPKATPSISSNKKATLDRKELTDSALSKNSAQRFTNMPSPDDSRFTDV